MTDFLTTLREFLESDELDEDDRRALKVIRHEYAKTYQYKEGHPSNHGKKFQKSVTESLKKGNKRRYLEIWDDKYLIVIKNIDDQISFNHIIIDDLEVTYNNDRLLIEKFKNDEIMWDDK